LRIGAYSIEVSLHEAERDAGLAQPPLDEPHGASAGASVRPDLADAHPYAGGLACGWDAQAEPPLAPGAPAPARRDAPFFADPLAAAPLLREPARPGSDFNEDLIAALGTGDALLANSLGVRDLPRPLRYAGSAFDHVSPERAMSAVPTLQPPPPQSNDGRWRPQAIIPDDYDPLASPAEQQADWPEHRVPAEHARARFPEPPPVDAQPEASAPTARIDDESLSALPPPGLWAASTAEPAKAGAPGAPGAPGDTVLCALLEGLGLDAAQFGNVPAPQLARRIGAMLREATQGAMTVLRSRSVAKRETRIAMTLIEERDNNPLKFFPDVDSALNQMLAGRGAGYLAPEEALRAAFRDIQSHEIAIVAGMRAALGHAMSSMDPQRIEASLRPGSRFEEMFTSRQARLWQKFVDTYEHAIRDVGDDFQQAFGEPFSRAYQAQLDAMEHRPEAPNDNASPKR
jgi:type VI secretion system FHA domain protein